MDVLKDIMIIIPAILISYKTYLEIKKLRSEVEKKEKERSE